MVQAGILKLDSLTGLRGLAAWLVVLAHTDGEIAAYLPAALEYGFRVCANLGLTAFFVLSGFVIHYNYGESIAKRGRIGAFLLARFARLYPLYLVVLILTVVVSPSIVHRASFGEWLPRYLTMTQDWWLTTVDNQSLAKMYVGSAWSISAEVGLYLFYIPAAFAIVRLRSIPAALVAVIAVTAAGTIFAGGFALGWWFGGVLHWGWWLSLSPYARLGEFALGALVAQLFLVCHPALSDREKRYHGALVAAGVAWIVAAFAISYRWPFFQQAFGFAPGVASLIFAFARYRGALAAAFDSRLAVTLGEASYSTYMLHGFVLWYVTTRYGSWGRPIDVMVAWPAIAVLSIVVYRTLESPARRLIRSIGKTKAPAEAGALAIVRAVD